MSEIHDRSNFVLWRWRDIYTPGSPKLYLRRLYLLRTPWFGLMINWIMEPDSDRWMHDHPWGFLSILLRGGYVEEVPNGIRAIRWMNVKAATDLHRILSVDKGTITVVLTSRKKRTWGFQTDSGWVSWRDYLSEAYQ